LTDQDIVKIKKIIFIVALYFFIVYNKSNQKERRQRMQNIIKSDTRDFATWYQVQQAITRDGGTAKLYYKVVKGEIIVYKAVIKNKGVKNIYMISEDKE